MDKREYLRKLRHLDHMFLDGKISQRQYETKRRRLQRAWLKRKRKSLGKRVERKD